MNPTKIEEALFHRHLDPIGESQPVILNHHNQDEEPPPPPPPPPEFSLPPLSEFDLLRSSSDEDSVSRTSSDADGPKPQIINPSQWQDIVMSFHGLKIVGVPFKLREGDVYDQIGGLFVWVTEESNSWVPIFSGIPSSDSSDSGGSSLSESSSSSDNEYQALEEREILQDVEGSLGDGNSPENPSLAPDEGQVNFPTILVLVNEQLSGDDRPSDKLQGGDNLFRMGTNLGSSRGSSPSQFKFGGSKARAITRKKMVGPVSLGGPGPHKVSPMGIKSRKRPRVISSPDSVFPSAAGIPNPLLDDSNLGNVCPDLNASPKLLQSDQMVSPKPNRSEDPGTTVDSLNVSTSAADFQSKEFQHFDMDLEVQETLSTGSCIGIDLTGHEGLVRAVIQGEGGHVVIQ
ncbi:hypothetical protein L1987_17757 [Smallanthus sonchifolius]|uniref:Uncharacterized protein n=1 Tax=Smallanthus sonchifolius TaxID=185202 RepID=A0ACB9IZC7_9ASTR|nr:hypothetical protein L1987_17757 [Smallanthus sonchifolius]